VADFIAYFILNVGFWFLVFGVIYVIYVQINKGLGRIVYRDYSENFKNTLVFPDKKPEVKKKKKKNFGIDHKDTRSACYSGNISDHLKNL
jgi:hypothetical protein